MSMGTFKAASLLCIAGLSFLATSKVFSEDLYMSYERYEIDLRTCEPTFTGKIKRMWDPKAFWISQNVALQETVEWNKSREYWIDAACPFYSTPEERKKCATGRSKGWTYILRCLKFSREMCRLHGGYC